MIRERGVRESESKGWWREAGFIPTHAAISCAMNGAPVRYPLSRVILIGLLQVSARLCFIVLWRFGA